MIRRAVMIEAMLAGLRIDCHAADRIENLLTIRVGLRMVMCAPAVGMWRRSFPAAAARLA